MSEIKVNSIKGVGSTDAAITINNSDGTCTANLTNKSNRNLIINGDMKIAQRGTSSTTSGFGTVDRFAVYYAGADEAPTQSQANVASGTTPYTNGFRKALKITNGNQTGGAGTGDQLYISHKIEAQDMATSGWDYTSTSSKITLSFWVKSSVAQNFYGYLKTSDGTSQNYPFETGSLSANTWTKITKTIIGNSNLQFDNDANTGIEIVIALWFGTDKTGSVSLNAWGAWSSSNRLPDFGAAMDDWYTTNDATFEITGVQLEVGHATDFEHRSFGQELALCQRYYFGGATSGTAYYGGRYSTNNSMVAVTLPVLMRNTPTVTNPTISGGGSLSTIYESNHQIHYYITGDTSAYVARADVKCDAEL